MKLRQGLNRQWMAAGDQRGQGIESVGHVARILEALQGLARPGGIATGPGRQTQVRQRHAGQRAAAARYRVGRVGAGVVVGFVHGFPVGFERAGELLAHRFTDSMDVLGVDDVELLCKVGFGRQRQHQVLEGRVQRRVAQNLAHGVQISII